MFRTTLVNPELKDLQHEKKIKVISILDRTDNGSAFYRTIQVAYNFNNYSNIQWDISDYLHNKNDKDYKIIILHRIYAFELVEKLKKEFDSVFIYELDDNFFKADNKESKEKVGRMINLMRQCDGVIVSTDYLKKIYSPYNENIFVIENAIDFNLVRGFFKANINSDKLKVIWSLSYSHRKDYNKVIKILNEIAEKDNEIEITLFGYYDKKASDKIKKLNWTKNIAEYYKVLSEYDVGLCLIDDDTEFNKGRSDLKAREYISLGLMPICSNTETYKNILMCIKVNNNFKDINNALNFCKKNIKLLRNNRIEKFQYAFENYNIDKISQKYLNVFKILVRRKYYGNSNN